MPFFYENYFRGRLTFPFSDVVLANSEAGLGAYRAPRGKRRFIHNGFDFNRIAHLEDKETLRKRLGVRTPQVVGMVGGFFERKDYGTFIEGGCQLLEACPGLTFLAVGNGPGLPRCRALVPEKYWDRLIFPGMLERVESVMNLFDVGVLLTNTEVHQEGISNSILEYMALGKPVVATTGGGTNEIVVDGLTGFLVPPHNPGAFASQVARLLDNPDLARKLGEQGRQRIREAFSIGKMVGEFRRLYGDLMGGKF
ncbi:MAG: glycosyltransferase family 4 protein [Bacteroidetes bacterium]|nr:glycosyltransferase family 4 protein [Bacteroidota bacterium]